MPPHPREERGMISEVERAVAEEMEQQPPSSEQDQEQRTIRQPPPKDARLAEQILGERGCALCIIGHADRTLAQSPAKPKTRRQAK